MNLSPQKQKRLRLLVRFVSSNSFSNLFLFYFPCALNVFSLTGFLTCHLRGRIWLPVERVASVPNFIFWPVRKPVNAVNVEAGYKTGLITVLFRILFSSYLTIKRLLRPSIPDNFEIVLKWTNTITFPRTRTQIGPIPKFRCYLRTNCCILSFCSDCPIRMFLTIFSAISATNQKIYLIGFLSILRFRFSLFSG